MRRKTGAIGYVTLKYTTRECSHLGTFWEQSVCKRSNTITMVLKGYCKTYIYFPFN